MNDERARHIIPSASYLKASAAGGLPGGHSYSGSFNGWSTGLGYTRNLTPSLSFFEFGMLSQLSGNIPISGAPSSLSDVSSSGYNLALGLSVRLWSPKSNLFSVGFLGGPFVSDYNASFNLVEQSVASYSYSANPLVYGMFGGLQIYMPISKFVFNPYVLYYDDLASQCFSYSTNNPTDSGGDSSDSCSQGGAVRQLSLVGTFLAYGLNLSLYSFTINVYSTVKNDTSFSIYSASNYALSYTFNF